LRVSNGNYVWDKKIIVINASDYQLLLDMVRTRTLPFRNMRVTQRLAGPQPNLSRSSNRLHFSP